LATHLRYYHMHERNLCETIEGCVNIFKRTPIGSETAQDEAEWLGAVLVYQHDEGIATKLGLPSD
jgi:hypothetical protein